MTFVEILRTFRVYGADVLLLALGVSCVTSLLKRTVLKKVPKKFYVFVPFAVGLLFYAVYRMIVTQSFAPLCADIFSTLEGGFACGCAATLYYVVYEQFFRKGKAETDPVAALLQGVVEEGQEEELAAATREKEKEVSEEELVLFIKETLSAHAPALTPFETEVHARLIADALKSMRT